MPVRVNERVQAATFLRGRLSLQLARALRRKHVPNRVVHVIAVGVDEIQPADACLGELERDGRAERAGADHDHVRTVESRQFRNSPLSLDARKRLGWQKEAAEARLVSALLLELGEHPAAPLLIARRPLLDEGKTDESGGEWQALLPSQLTIEPREDRRVNAVDRLEDALGKVLRPWRRGESDPTSRNFDSAARVLLDEIPVGGADAVSLGEDPYVPGPSPQRHGTVRRAQVVDQERLGDEDNDLVVVQELRAHGLGHVGLAFADRRLPRFGVLEEGAKVLADQLAGRPRRMPVVRRLLEQAVV